MPRPPSPSLTEVELQVLQVLWDHGPSTARQIHDHLTKLRDTAYSSTTKMLSVMLGKGLLARDESRRPAIFSPALDEASAQGRVVRDVVKRVYRGSAAGLVMRALSDEGVSDDELAEIRAMLDRLEDDRS